MLLENTIHKSDHWIIVELRGEIKSVGAVGKWWFYHNGGALEERMRACIEPASK